MKKEIKEVQFSNDRAERSHFEVVKYEDVLKKRPLDHSQFYDHKIAFYALLLFTEGAGQYNVNFKDYRFSKGSIFTLEKNTIHKFYKNSAKGYLIVFTKDFISFQLSNIEAADTFLLFNEFLSPPKLQLSKKLYQEILTLVQLIEIEHKRTSDIHTALIKRNLLLAIFFKLLRVKLKTDVLLMSNDTLTLFIEFQKLVEDNCFGNRLVKYYASMLNVTSKRLNQVTQSIIETTAKSFIKDTFLIQVKRLIINSPVSLTEISYEIGFDEPTNFFKYFLKHVGLSAKEFRNNSRHPN